MPALGLLRWWIGLAVAALGPAALAQEPAEACWIRDVAVFGDEVTWVLCENGRILKSQDAGATWSAIDAGRVRARAIALGSRDYAIVAGAGGLVLVTEDGGQSWRRADTGVTSHLNAVAIRGGQAWVAGNDGVILHSPDRGRTFHLERTFTRDNLESIYFADELHGWAVGWNGTILRTADGGEFWEPAPAEGVHHVLKSVYFRDASEGWAAGVPGLILHTTDGGRSWTRLDSPDPGWLNSICFTSDGTGYIAGERLLASYDGGRSWRPLALNVPETLVAIVLQKGRLWAFGPHTVASSADGGASWEAATNFWQSEARERVG